MNNNQRWYQNNNGRERSKQRVAKWRAAHLEESRQQTRDYYEAHKEELRVKAKARYEARRDAHKAKSDPNYLDYWRRRKQVRRARKAQVENTLTQQEWDEVVASHDSECAYCGNKIERPEIDHVIPISKGGAHSKENVVPACKSCNSAKGDRIVDVPA